MKRLSKAQLQKGPNIVYDPFEEMLREDDRPKWFQVLREKITEMPGALDDICHVMMPPYTEEVGLNGFRFSKDFPYKEEVILKRLKEIAEEFGLKEKEKMIHGPNAFGEMVVSVLWEPIKVDQFAKKVFLKRGHYEEIGRKRGKRK